MIHPSAIVEPGAQLGADCVIHAYAVVTRHCVLGDRVVVHPHAVLGGDPQDLRFEAATVSGVRIGSDSVIREFVTVNRATRPGACTELGERCFLMAVAHVGHDCRVGRGVVLANNVMLGGHVQVGDFSFVGGGAGVHQNGRIGEGAMIAGLARVAADVAPFTLMAERNELFGLNLVGLKRRGVSREAVSELKEAYHALFAEPGNLRRRAEARLAEQPPRSPEARCFLEFFTAGQRTFAHPQRQEAGGGDVGNG